MSKKQPKANKLSYQLTTKKPKLGKILTSWQLENLYYSSSKDEQIETDIKKVERLYTAFAKKYKDTDFTRNTSALHRALQDYEKLASLPEKSKAMRYFGFRSVLNSHDDVAEKFEQKLSNRLTETYNKVLFFSLRLAAMPKQQRQTVLNNKKLGKYHYFLVRVFKGGEYNLSEPEERLLNLYSGPAYGMWLSMTEKIIAKTNVTFNKKKIPLTTALETLDTYPRQQRIKLWDTITDALEPIGQVTENELAAIATAKMHEDKLRGFKKPYSETVLSYEDEDKSIEALLEAVRTEGFKLSRDFYKAKARIHGKKQLLYAERYETIGDDLYITFKEAVAIARDVFYSLKTEYGAIFDTMLTNGQIDVYPKPGKRGGAFMSEGINVPTQVMLNHSSTFKALETLAHEMGHAIHSERSKAQPVFYQGHSITTAETASTLFENLLFDAVFDQAPESAKPVLLHDRITRDISTIQRQIAFFNFELAMHTKVREQGVVTHKELSKLMADILSDYLGPAVKVTERDGCSYTFVPHFRYGFYVYTYTFGILMSTIMANNYQSDRGYIKEIDSFLSSGQSDTVANIFKSIGINTTKSTTFLDALQNHKKDITAFKKLTGS